VVASDAYGDGDANGGPERRPVYSIGAVVKMLGVDASTLRAWEERYQVVVPLRSQGGQRLYSRNNLEHLRFVLAEREQGSSPADAHRLLAEKLHSLAAMTPLEPESPTVVILLAERDRYAAELSEYFLRTEGYEVCLAFDPGTAERVLAERRPDLSVVELMLSGGGLDLCRRLAQSSDAPVLALSALDLADEALSAGASAFLAKPINPLQFVSAVRDLLGQSALTKPSRTSVS
jgi:DNA-binding transcriptional MerR regulator